MKTVAKGPNTRILAASALVLVACFAAWILLRPSGHYAAAQSLANHIERQEWGAIYDMASDLEKSRQPWSKENYVALLQELSTTCCSKVGSITIKDTGDLPETLRVYTLTFQGERVGVGPEEVEMLITFRSDAEGWHPDAFTVPLQLHNLRKKSTPESLRKFSVAAHKAGIVALARVADNLLFSIDRLDQYLDGKIKWQSVYTHRPNIEALNKLAKVYRSRS
jgi:hypothetical protein